MDSKDTQNEWAREAVAAMLEQCMRSLETELALELRLVLAAKVRLGL